MSAFAMPSSTIQGYVMNTKISLLFLLVSALCYSIQGAADEVVIDTIPQSVLLDYLAEGEAFTLIDARSSEEYAAGHVYGAVNLPHDADLAVSEALPADQAAAIVVYCRSGQRAYQLSQRLAELGYSDVKVLAPTQMIWADNLPVFNCGAEAPRPFTLVIAKANAANTGVNP
jgi:rhodanese-related sulfurtransferase